MASEKETAKKRSPAAAGKKPSAAARRNPASAGTQSGKKGAASVRATAKKKPATAKTRKPDEYDALMANSRKAARKKRRRRDAWTTGFLTAGIVGVSSMMLLQGMQYSAFNQMKTAVEHQQFYAGTTVEGLDVSGMTLSDALSYWEEKVEPQYTERTVTLDNGASFSAVELGYSSDYRTVLTNAWSAGRQGSLKDRYDAVSSRVERPESYQITRRQYDPERVSACVQAIAEEIDRPAQNAHVDTFDLQNYTFTFAEEQTGSRLDQEKLLADMERVLENGSGSVTLPVEAIQPETRISDIDGQYGMIAYAVTNASTSAENRLSNIRLALQMINGLCLEPGQGFSFNATVGKRTTDRGFKSAPAYSSGTVIKEVGGGICQVSTTLFNAVVKADLQVTERHNHSLPVSYVDRGKDATVDWGNQDFCFVNTSPDRIYICCVLDGSKRVRIGIFGKLLPNGETITVESETVGTIGYETVYQVNPGFPTGFAQVTQPGKVGYRAIAYKVRRDASGNVLARDELCRSVYRATNEVVEYGA